MTGTECELCVAAIQARPAGGASEERAVSRDNGRKEAEGGRAKRSRTKKRRSRRKPQVAAGSAGAEQHRAAFYPFKIIVMMTIKKNKIMELFTVNSCSCTGR